MFQSDGGLREAGVDRFDVDVTAKKEARRGQQDDDQRGFATMRQLCRRVCAPATLRLPVVARKSVRLVRDTASAGRMPVSTLVSRDTAMVKSRTRVSREASRRRGMLPGSRSGSRRRKANARPMPIAPAARR